MPEASANANLIARTTEALELLGKTATLLPRQDDGASISGLGGLIDLIQDLLRSIGPILDLLNPETFKQIQSVLKNANDLLTPDFVEHVKGLVGDVAPLVSAVAQLISALLGAILG
ncbi:hypothetical protein VTO42DRAFT_6599 [Malbranchea cinnamomea]